MSHEAPASREASALAAIFQKAYARAVALQRLDEQIATLIDQRQQLESDFREAQQEVNEECDRMLRNSSVAPARMLAQLTHDARVAEDALEGGPNGRMARMNAAAAAVANAVVNPRPMTPNL